MDVDVVSYYGGNGLTYSEVFIGVPRSALIYSKLTEDSLRATFSIIVSLSSSDTVFLSDTLDAEDVVSAGFAPSQGAFFPYTFRYYLVPGTYGLDASLVQVEGHSIRKKDLAISIPAISDSFGLSEIALGAEMKFGAEEGSFTRNGIRFVPNPSAFYGSELPMLYYYTECYGLDTSKAQADSVTLVRTVRTGDSGTEAKLPSIRRIKKPGASLVIADGFPAYTLKTGTYVLELLVQEENRPDRLSRRKFYVYRPEDISQGYAPELDVAMQQALLVSGEDILNTIDPDSALDIMSYVMTKQDQRRVRNMEPDGKRRFLIEFWHERDPDDPEAANRYFARAAEANHRYSFLNQQGWKTDRGRILIQHGEPDFMDRRYAEAQVPDHEIWHFDRLEGGVLFVFFDRSGFGDLDLVHSTMRGEIYNPDWAKSVQDRNSSTRGLRD
ncbi:MAG: GWxTD domain-containing protein [bacterium]|nr:GWxTD domain-containing protein [bacterium]